MDLHYPADVEAIAAIPDDQRPAFEKWFSDLESEHTKRGSPYGDGGLAKNTGVECWIEFFKDEWSAAGALDEDLSYGDE